MCFFCLELISFEQRMDLKCAQIEALTTRALQRGPVKNGFRCGQKPLDVHVPMRKYELRHAKLVIHSWHNYFIWVVNHFIWLIMASVRNHRSPHSDLGARACVAFAVRARGVMNMGNRSRWYISVVIFGAHLKQVWNSSGARPHETAVPHIRSHFTWLRGAASNSSRILHMFSWWNAWNFHFSITSAPLRPPLLFARLTACTLVIAVWEHNFV